MTADVTGDVTAQLCEGDLEVSQRFPGLSGKIQIDAIMRAYTEPMTRTIPFFSPSGERLLFRHAENKRPVDVSLEKYTKQLRNEGARAWCSWLVVVYAQGSNRHR